MQGSRSMRRWAVVATWLAAGFMLPALARVPELVDLPVEGGIPESLSVAADGTVFIGGNRGILMRARPGMRQAEAWVTLGGQGQMGISGVLADDRNRQVWLCASEALPDGQRRATLRTFDQRSGQARGVFTTPQGSGCNDVTLARDGSAYVTDTGNRRILRLAPGETQLQPWYQDERFVFVNGITIVDGQLYVTCTRPSGMYRIDVAGDGSAVGATPIVLSRPLAIPDGIRGLDRGRILVAEMGASAVKDGIQGKATLVTVRANEGEVKVLSSGYMGPSAISPAGAGAALILESKTQFRVDPIVINAPPGTIRAFRVDVPPAGR